jgi:hypothetical protein
MGLLALHVDNEAETASVVLKLRVVKTLFRRRRNQSLFGAGVTIISIFVQIAAHRSAYKPAFTYFLLDFHPCAINVFKNCGDFALERCVFVASV